jgi:hypothetical protein
MTVVVAELMKEAQEINDDQLLKLIQQEFRSWLSSVLREHLQERLNKMLDQDRYLPLWFGEQLMALIIFLVPALVLWLSSSISTKTEWFGNIMIVLVFGSLIGPLFLAIVQGFPPWSPPYLGVLLMIFVFYGPFWPVWGLIYPSFINRFGHLNSWSLPVRIFSSVITSALTWLLVLLAAVLLVTILRLFPHFRSLWQRIREDWTQLSLMVFGGLIPYVILIFDDYQRDEVWQVSALITLAVGCWLYLRARDWKGRILFLLGSATLAMWILAAGKWFLVPQQNWPVDLESERPYEALRTLTAWVSILAALMAPALLKLWSQPQEPEKYEELSTV